MNKSTKAILKDLIKGEKLDVLTFYKLYGYSNIARELSRKIEKPFSFLLKREKMVSKNRFGESCWYYQYSLKKEDVKKAKNLLND